MESLTPIKIDYLLPLGDLEHIVGNSNNIIFETNQILTERGRGLLIDSNGSLYSCVLISENEKEVVFKEDKQDRVFWIENQQLTFVEKEKVHFSGHLSFWTTHKSLRHSDVSVLYKAIFVDGILTKVELVDSKIIPVQAKKYNHKLQRTLLILASKIVHNVSVFLLQLIHNRIIKISS